MSSPCSSSSLCVSNTSIQRHTSDRCSMLNSSQRWKLDLLNNCRSNFVSPDTDCWIFESHLVFGHHASLDPVSWYSNVFCSWPISCGATLNWSAGLSEASSTRDLAQDIVVSSWWFNIEYDPRQSDTRKELGEFDSTRACNSIFVTRQRVLIVGAKILLKIRTMNLPTRSCVDSFRSSSATPKRRRLCFSSQLSHSRTWGYVCDFCRECQRRRRKGDKVTSTLLALSRSRSWTAEQLSRHTARAVRTRNPSRKKKSIGETQHDLQDV